MIGISARAWQWHQMQDVSLYIPYQDFKEWLEKLTL